MKRKFCAAALLFFVVLCFAFPASAGGGYYHIDPETSEGAEPGGADKSGSGGGDALPPSSSDEVESEEPLPSESDSPGSGGEGTDDPQAEEGPEGMTEQELLEQQYEASGAEDLEKALPDDTKRIMAEYDISPENPASITGLTAGNLFGMLFNMIGDIYSAPLKAAAAVIAVIFLICLMEAFGSSFSGKTISGVFQFISTAAAGAILILPVMDCVTRAVGAISLSANFMLVLCPIYAGILIASGKPASALGFQSLIFSAAQVVAQIASNFISPVVSMYLGVSVASSVSPGVNLNGLCEAFKKAVTWILGACMTLFVGLLGVQTAIHSAADSAANKAAKFFVGTFVPVVGSSIGDALGSVQSCMGILKSSVGIYAVLSVFIMLLPVILEILLYKLCVFGCASVAELFDLKNITNLLKAIGSALSLILAVMICCLILFIVSLAIMIVTRTG